MAVRVTDDEVKEIIETSLTTDPFITAANLTINNQLVTEIAAGDVDDDTLKEMERWLAAHFVAAREQQPIEETLGDARIKYQGKFGEGLKSTIYGQRAMDLDPTGRLGLSGQRTAEFKTIDFDIGD